MAAIALVTGLLLFLPSWLLTGVGIGGFRKENLGWIVLSFGFSISYLATYPLYSCWLWVADRCPKVRRLQHLTTDEKQVLLEYIDNNVRSVLLWHDAHLEGPANQFWAEGILDRFDNTDPVGATKYSWTIKPWVVKHLKKRPGLLRQPQHLPPPVAPSR